MGVESIRPRDYYFLFSCSTQLSMKFSLLINMKMTVIVGIFIFIGRDFSAQLFSR